MTVKEATGESICVPANGVTRNMAATWSDRDATVKDANGDGTTVKDAKGDTAIVKEATGESICVPANGVTR